MYLYKDELRRVAWHAGYWGICAAVIGILFSVDALKWDTQIPDYVRQFLEERIDLKPYVFEVTVAGLLSGIIAIAGGGSSKLMISAREEISRILYTLGWLSGAVGPLLFYIKLHSGRQENSDYMILFQSLMIAFALSIVGAAINLLGRNQDSTRLNEDDFCTQLESLRIGQSVTLPKFMLDTIFFPTDSQSRERLHLKISQRRIEMIENDTLSEIKFSRRP